MGLLPIQFLCMISSDGTNELANGTMPERAGQWDNIPVRKTLRLGNIDGTDPRRSLSCECPLLFRRLALAAHGLLLTAAACAYRRRPTQFRTAASSSLARGGGGGSVATATAAA